MTDDDEYDYEENNYPDPKNANYGSRLIGAQATSTKKYPFLVAINLNLLENDFEVKCSVSLITPTYVLSAAHCNEYILQRSGSRKRRRRKCVQNTLRGDFTEVFKDTKMVKVWCKWIKDKRDNDRRIALEIRTQPSAKVWMGVDNANEETFGVESSENIQNVKRHIRHINSYKGGGGYGKFGGYDFTLLELEHPFNNFKPACLPSPTFNDISSKQQDKIIAGYGYYHRSDHYCETNSYGKMKYHYCDQEIELRDRNMCNAGKPPPMPEECSKFFKDPNTPAKVPSSVEEIKINGLPSKGPIYCYPTNNPENSSFGWCWTQGNYYHRDRVIHSYEGGWGFCGKDCFLDRETPLTGILRVKLNVSVLSKEICESFLNESLGSMTRIRPMILCVGKTETFKEEVWEKSGDSYRLVNTSNIRPERYGLKEYVASVGTCMGDSGGPLFAKEANNFVILGEFFSIQ